MSKRRRDPLLEALKEGRSYTWTVPEGGNLASMRKAIKHGQTLTMSPLTETDEIQIGDLVLVKWHQGDIFHIVGEVQDGQYLIVNSLGKVNGWVGRQEILGKITKIVEPEPRPEVPLLLQQLEGACFDLIEQVQPGLLMGNACSLLSMTCDGMLTGSAPNAGMSCRVTISGAFTRTCGGWQGRQQPCSNKRQWKPTN